MTVPLPDLQEPLTLSQIRVLAAIHRSNVNYHRAPDAWVDQRTEALHKGSIYALARRGIVVWGADPGVVRIRNAHLELAAAACAWLEAQPR